jgi:hypothetical protein
MKTKNLVNEVPSFLLEEKSEVVTLTATDTVESLKAKIDLLRKELAEAKEKSKETKSKLTRPEAVGFILAKYPEGKTEEELITLANDYFTEITGKAKNEKETRWLFGYAKNFLKGYGRK